MAEPVATRRAYSAFLIEWTETLSTIVSTRPDVSPVMRMRKLLSKPAASDAKATFANRERKGHSLPHPARALLLLPDTDEALE